MLYGSPICDTKIKLCEFEKLKGQLNLLVAKNHEINIFFANSVTVKNTFRYHLVRYCMVEVC